MYLNIITRLHSYIYIILLLDVTVGCSVDRSGLEDGALVEVNGVASIGVKSQLVAFLTSMTSKATNPGVLFPLLATN